MDKKTLLIFAKRIFNSSSENKAMVSLRQLKTLLEEQGAPKSDIVLLEKMIQSAPEMKEAAQKAVLTEVDIEIAERVGKSVPQIKLRKELRPLKGDPAHLEAELFVDLEDHHRIVALRHENRGDCGVPVSPVVVKFTQCGGTFAEFSRVEESPLGNGDELAQVAGFELFVAPDLNFCDPFLEFQMENDVDMLSVGVVGHRLNVGKVAGAVEGADITVKDLAGINRSGSETHIVLKQLLSQRRGAFLLKFDRSHRGA